MSVAWHVRACKANRTAAHQLKHTKREQSSLVNGEEISLKQPNSYPILYFWVWIYRLPIVVDVSGSLFPELCQGVGSARCRCKCEPRETMQPCVCMGLQQLQSGPWRLEYLFAHQLSHIRCQVKSIRMLAPPACVFVLVHSLETVSIEP